MWYLGTKVEYTSRCAMCLHYGEPDFNDIQKKWFHFQSYGAIGIQAIKFECKASELRRLAEPKLFLPTLAYSVATPKD